MLTDLDEAALVVSGQKGHGALKALHLGSTAEYVAQHLAAPTVIAKTNTPVRNVLVATDGSDHARAVIKTTSAYVLVARKAEPR